MFSSIQQNITCQIQTDLDGPAPVTIPPVQLEHGLLKSHTWWADPGLAVFDSGSWSEPRRWCRRPVVLLEWPVWTEPATDTTWVRTIADFWEGFYLKCFFLLPVEASCCGWVWGDEETDHLLFWISWTVSTSRRISPTDTASLIQLCSVALVNSLGLWRSSSLTLFLNHWNNNRYCAYIELGDTFSRPHTMLWGLSWARAGPGRGFRCCTVWRWSRTQ